MKFKVILIVVICLASFTSHAGPGKLTWKTKFHVSAQVCKSIFDAALVFRTSQKMYAARDPEAIFAKASLASKVRLLEDLNENLMDGVYPSMRAAKEKLNSLLRVLGRRPLSVDDKLFFTFHWVPRFLHHLPPELLVRDDVKKMIENLFDYTLHLAGVGTYIARSNLHGGKWTIYPEAILASMGFFKFAERYPDSPLWNYANQHLLAVATALTVFPVGELPPGAVVRDLMQVRMTALDVLPQLLQLKANEETKRQFLLPVAEMVTRTLAESSEEPEILREKARQTRERLLELAAECPKLATDL